MTFVFTLFTLFTPFPLRVRVHHSHHMLWFTLFTPFTLKYRALQDQSSSDIQLILFSPFTHHLHLLHYLHLLHLKSQTLHLSHHMLWFTLFTPFTPFTLRYRAPQVQSSCDIQMISFTPFTPFTRGRETISFQITLIVFTPFTTEVAGDRLTYSLLDDLRIYTFYTIYTFST